MFAVTQLAEWTEDVTARLLGTVDDLEPDELTVPYMPTINPPVWEVCHAVYFLEYWVLRDLLGQPPFRADYDAIFDSMTVGHESRWRLRVPDVAGARAYLEDVRDRVLAALGADHRDELLPYRVAYSVFHGDMHVEAIAYCRQALGLSNADVRAREPTARTEDASGDASIGGGVFELGARDDGSFCFDNEKWAHPVELDPFAIARTAVTEGQFAAFVDDEAYTRRELWSPRGWRWLQSVQVELPLYWRRGASGFERRVFDEWAPIAPSRAMMHVNWYEADAYCRWAGRRLPSEAEWELAAATPEKRPLPWGDEPATAQRANFDGAYGGAIDAAALAGGDSATGVRQMLGNVWEWT
ncbi:MAG: SUMF1/EgtB/PvdO family nonheme iron enzyme, partial [Planctomycetes bacterium]|nr:SUMF1/EgtB/PvdO family nonheme iron enzyme [Planctomycetota bacterium]